MNLSVQTPGSDVIVKTNPLPSFIFWKTCSTPPQDALSNPQPPAVLHSPNCFQTRQWRDIHDCPRKRTSPYTQLREGSFHLLRIRDSHHKCILWRANSFDPSCNPNCRAAESLWRRKFLSSLLKRNRWIFLCKGLAPVHIFLIAGQMLLKSSTCPVAL